MVKCHHCLYADYEFCQRVNLKDIGTMYKAITATTVFKDPAATMYLHLECTIYRMAWLCVCTHTVSTTFSIGTHRWNEGHKTFLWMIKGRYSPFVYRDGTGWPASLPYIRKIHVSVAIGTQSGIRLHKRVPMVKIWGSSKNDQNWITGKLLKL